MPTLEQIAPPLEAPESPVRQPESPVRHLTSRLIAHRGLHGPGRPENSLAAFDAAARAGYAVEADVHVTADREVLVFHDRTLDRMCHVPGSIGRVTAEDRARLRLDGTTQTIPTLAEVAEVVAGRVPIFLDMKPTDAWAAVHPGAWRRECREVARVLVEYPGPVGIMAWDPRQLRWFAFHHPHIWRIQSGGVAAEVSLAPGVAPILNQLHRARMSKPHAISYNAALVRRGSVQRARCAGLPVLAWTVRSSQELAALAGWADNAVFEGFRPDPAGLLARPDQRSANLAEPCSPVPSPDPSPVLPHAPSPTPPTGLKPLPSLA